MLSSVKVKSSVPDYTDPFYKENDSRLTTFLVFAGWIQNKWQVHIINLEIDKEAYRKHIEEPNAFTFLDTIAMQNKEKKNQPALKLSKFLIIMLQLLKHLEKGILLHS